MRQREEFSFKDRCDGSGAMRMKYRRKRFENKFSGNVLGPDVRSLEGSWSLKSLTISINEGVLGQLNNRLGMIPLTNIKRMRVR